MECDNCNAWMRRIMEPNGKVYWHCPVCGYTEETGELAPEPTDDWGENNVSKEINSKG